jgi:hypothetical protein
MFDFTIDRSKAVELAKNLGLKVSFGASSPGIRINNGEDSMFFSIKEFFPELNSPKNTHFCEITTDRMRVGKA